MRQNNLGQIVVTMSFLEALLGLPETIRIRGVVGDLDEQVSTRRVRIVIEGPGLPIVPECAAPVTVVPDWDEEGNLVAWDTAAWPLTGDDWMKRLEGGKE